MALKIVLYSAGICLLIFIVLMNAIGNRNKLRSAIFYGISFVASSLILLICYLVDSKKGLIPEGEARLAYFLPLALLSFVFFGFTIYFFIQALLTHSTIGKGSKTYHNDTNQYLYIVYKVDGMYYLKKDNDGKYEANIVKFGKSSVYYDEFLDKYINENGLDVRNSSFKGTATNYSKKKKTIFYCFLLELNDNVKLYEYEKLDPFKIANVPMLDFHKTLTLNILIGENFNIEV